MNWHDTETLMPLRNDFVLVRTPFCRYPATVAFYNGIDWIGADDHKILNVSLWTNIEI